MSLSNLSSLQKTILLVVVCGIVAVAAFIILGDLKVAGAGGGGAAALLYKKMQDATNAEADKTKEQADVAKAAAARLEDIKVEEATETAVVDNRADTASDEEIASSVGDRYKREDKA